MKASRNEWLAVAGLTLGFFSLAGAFLLNLWGRPETASPLPGVDAKFTNTSPVRISAAELIRSGGDSSGLDCYACHERNKVLKLEFDANNQVILPEEHNDLVMRHGRNGRNNDCFNCHNPEKLDELRTPDGRKYTWAESSKLCASCHGPTYRDWEVGIHGRTSGYWEPAGGARTKLECASCHHPHDPAFPPQNPAPGPHVLHPGASRPAESAH